MRPDFVLTHAQAMLRALDAGVPLRGYFHWTCIDNFEWAEGYAAKFGLIANDLATQRAQAATQCQGLCRALPDRNRPAQRGTAAGAGRSGWRAAGRQTFADASPAGRQVGDDEVLVHDRQSPAVEIQFGRQPVVAVGMEPDQRLGNQGSRLRLVRNRDPLLTPEAPPCEPDPRRAPPA